MKFYATVDGKFQEMYDAEEFGEKVKATIKFYQNSAKEKEAQANKTKEEVLKDFKEDYNRLLADYRRCPAQFSKAEAKSYGAFVKEHYNLHGKDSGTILHISGTGIGMVYEVECPICHKKEDITDISSW